MAAAQSWPDYGYAGQTFDGFVRESFQVVGKGKPADFYAYMERGFRRETRGGVTAWINLKRGELSASTDKPTTRLAIASEAHRLIKRVIPKFSLDRGFEFAYTTNLGERQCFLQSVLLDSLLHRIGMESGTVMVYRNPKGAASNLGHACNLVRLSSDRAVLIDCSHAEAVISHQGLFLRVNGKYTFVRPQYQNRQIVAFWPAAGGGSIGPSVAAPLTIPYLGSMFDYYRGERVPNGLIAPNGTPEALAESVRHLERSVRRSDQNPLALFQLARAYARQGRKGQAQLRLDQAVKVYRAAGFTPDSVKAFQKTLAETH